MTKERRPTSYGRANYLPVLRARRVQTKHAASEAAIGKRNAKTKGRTRCCFLSVSVVPARHLNQPGSRKPVSVGVHYVSARPSLAKINCGDGTTYLLLYVRPRARGRAKTACDMTPSSLTANSARVKDRMRVPDGRSTWAAGNANEPQLLRSDIHFAFVHHGSRLRRMILFECCMRYDRLITLQSIECECLKFDAQLPWLPEQRHDTTLCNVDA